MKSSKGSAFERQVAVLLSKWWTHGEQDDIFWRSQTSGGRATIRGRKGKSTFGQYGDIQACDPKGQPLLDTCCIELKKGYKGWSVMDSLDKNATAAEQIIEKFLSQATAQAENAKVPYFLLITKRDKRDPLVFMPAELYKDITLWVGLFKHESRMGVSRMRFLHEREHKDDVVVLRLDHFLDWCSPEYFTKDKQANVAQSSN